MSVETRYRYRYRAVMPERAWQGGQEPRERARRWEATQDLIDGLKRYMPDLLTTISYREGKRERALDITDWIVWAAQLGLGRHLAGAPDGSDWWINTRWETSW